jgi:hypothetical protein
MRLPSWGKHNPSILNAGIERIAVTEPKPATQLCWENNLTLG